MNRNMFLGRISWGVGVLGSPRIGPIFREVKPPERIILRGSSSREARIESNRQIRGHTS